MGKIISGLTVADVARILRVSRSRVIQLDEELKPLRNYRNERRYDPNVVKAYMEKRKQKRISSRKTSAGGEGIHGDKR